MSPGLASEPVAVRVNGVRTGMVNPGAVWTFGALLDVAVSVPPFVRGPPTTASRTKPLAPPLKLEGRSWRLIHVAVEGHREAVLIQRAGVIAAQFVTVTVALPPIAASIAALIPFERVVRAVGDRLGCAAVEEMSKLSMPLKSPATRAAPTRAAGFLG